MAEFIVKIDGVKGTTTRTLNFMGKSYTEVWVDDNTYCECGIETLVEKDYPDMDDYTAKIIQDTASFDEDELFEAMSELTEYERSE